MALVSLSVPRHATLTATTSQNQNGRAGFRCLTIINGKPSCLCFAAFKVEQAVVDMVLEACQPMAIEASL
jgi:hypothetical protein